MFEDSKCWSEEAEVCSSISSSSSPLAFNPKNAANIIHPPNRVKIVVNVESIHAGCFKMASLTTATGTWRASPEVASVGPVQYDGVLV